MFNMMCMYGIDLTKSLSDKKINKLENNIQLMNKFNELLKIAMERYGFENLPETISERLLLLSMIIYGNFTFFDKKGVLLGLPSVPSGKGFNMNGDPLSAWVYARNGAFNEEISLHVPGELDSSYIKEMTGGITIQNEPSGVMIWENKTRYPFINEVFYFADAIADTYRSIDVARVWLKRPFIPICDEELKDDVKAMLKGYKNNQEALIFSSAMMTVNKFDILNVDTTNSVQKLVEVVDWYENKFREKCGIEANAQIDKKGENLISDELDITTDFTERHENEIIEYINEQLDFVNKIFGTNIKCVEKGVSDKTAEKHDEVNNDERNNETDI